jgi:hypothetical protein
VSASLQQGGRATSGDTIQRVPALAIEKLIGEIVERWVSKADNPLQLPLSVTISSTGLLIDMPARLAPELSAGLTEAETVVYRSRHKCRIEVPIALPLRGGRRLIVAGQRTATPDRVLISGLRRAHKMVERHRGLPIVSVAPASRYERELLRLAFLAPDIQRDILAGRQPPSLTLEKLRHIEIPLCWDQQRRAFGWS